MKKQLRYWALTLSLLGFSPLLVAVEIDLLVVYTPSALTTVGGEAPMKAKIDFMLNDMNVIMLNSQLDHRFRLVGLRLINYQEAGISKSTLLTRLADEIHFAEGTSPLDGHMDAVHQWRDEVGADLVQLVISPLGGIAQTPTQDIHFVASPLTGNKGYKGFSVIGLTHPLIDPSVYFGFISAHEIGHNFGCQHSPESEDPPTAPLLRSYGKGHQFYGTNLIGYQTVMGNRIPPFFWPIWYYSNPDVYFAGAPTGIANDRDCARLIDVTAPWVADYRATVIPDNEVWVDTTFSGIELGTESNPYNTVQEGLDNVPSPGTIKFKGVSDNWTGPINQPVRLEAVGGDMTIGQ